MVALFINSTSASFANAIVAQKSHTFVSVVYENEVRMNKRGNPYYGRVTKRVTAQMSYCYSYENACNNRISEEGVTFVAESLPWGSWFIPNKVITHKGEYYIRLYDINGRTPKIEYFVDGKPATMAQYREFAGFLQKDKTTSAKQSEHGIEEERQVMPRAIKVKTIKEFTMNGVTYKM
jgi:hypothetical protein